MRFLDMLTEEHRAFTAMLDVLDAVAARLDRGADVPTGVVADVLDFFQHFAKAHHDKEEAVLFPLLARHGMGPDQTVVNALHSQHEAGRMYEAKLRNELKSLAAGDPGSAPALTADARSYTDLIREHIRIEDEYFYRLADQALTEAEHARVAREFDRPAESREAEAERQRCRRMLEIYPALVERWSRDA
jgi:hemerythrin-like domain-containing protein